MLGHFIDLDYDSTVTVLYIYGHLHLQWPKCSQPLVGIDKEDMSVRQVIRQVIRWGSRLHSEHYRGPVDSDEVALPVMNTERNRRAN